MSSGIPSGPMVWLLPAEYVSGVNGRIPIVLAI
jgi:hypothetical protein